MHKSLQRADELFGSFVKKLKSVGSFIQDMNGFVRSMGARCTERMGKFLCIIPSFVAKQARKLITDPLKDAADKIKVSAFDPNADKPQYGALHVSKFSY